MGGIVPPTERRRNGDSYERTDDCIKCNGRNARRSSGTGKGLYDSKANDRGMVRATFQNPSMEEAAVKMTLTGLNPGAVFEISIGRQVQSLQFKKANSAGILETKWIIPENSVLQVCEVKSRKTDR